MTGNDFQNTDIFPAVFTESIVGVCMCLCAWTVWACTLLLCLYACLHIHGTLIVCLYIAGLFPYLKGFLQSPQHFSDSIL